VGLGADHEIGVNQGVRALIVAQGAQVGPTERLTASGLDHGELIKQLGMRTRTGKNNRARLC
jgi:hypothetical protein